MKSKDKNYWEKRKLSKHSFRFLKELRFFRKLFSVRSADEDFLYDFMKKNMDDFNIYVNGCEYFYFETEKAILKKTREIMNIKLKETKVLCANPTFSQFLAAKGISIQSSLMKVICVVADLIISQINNFGRHASGFVVSHNFNFIEKNR